MTGVVVDTSVAIAWYLPEAFSAAARSWHAKILSQNVTAYVPSLHYWEFANVMRTYVRRKEIAPEIASEIWNLHLDAPIEAAEPQRKGVLEVALEYDASVYDAVYIALALDLDLSIVTAERASTAWVTKLGERAITL